MGEIKISVSEKLDKLIQKAADDLGIKKAEYVKWLVVGNFKDKEESGKGGGR